MTTAPPRILDYHRPGDHPHRPCSRPRAAAAAGFVAGVVVLACVSWAGFDDVLLAASWPVTDAVTRLILSIAGPLRIPPHIDCKVAVIVTPLFWSSLGALLGLTSSLLSRHGAAAQRDRSPDAATSRTPFRCAPLKKSKIFSRFS